LRGTGVVVTVFHGEVTTTRRRKKSPAGKYIATELSLSRKNAEIADDDN